LLTEAAVYYIFVVFLCVSKMNMRWRAADQEVDQRGHGER